jgi:hypothetical protein
MKPRPTDFSDWSDKAAQRMANVSSEVFHREGASVLIWLAHDLAQDTFTDAGMLARFVLASVAGCNIEALSDEARLAMSLLRDRGN